MWCYESNCLSNFILLLVLGQIQCIRKKKKKNKSTTTFRDHSCKQQWHHKLYGTGEPTSWPYQLRKPSCWQDPDNTNLSLGEPGQQKWRSWLTWRVCYFFWVFPTCYWDPRQGKLTTGLQGALVKARASAILSGSLLFTDRLWTHSGHQEDCLVEVKAICSHRAGKPGGEMTQHKPHPHSWPLACRGWTLVAEPGPVSGWINSPRHSQETNQVQGIQPGATEDKVTTKVWEVHPGGRTRGRTGCRHIYSISSRRSDGPRLRRSRQSAWTSTQVTLFRVIRPINNIRCDTALLLKSAQELTEIECNSTATIWSFLPQQKPRTVHFSITCQHFDFKSSKFPGIPHLFCYPPHAKVEGEKSLSHGEENNEKQNIEVISAVVQTELHFLCCTLSVPSHGTNCWETHQHP